MMGACGGGVGLGLCTLLYIWTVSSFLVFCASISSLFSREKTKRVVDGKHKRTFAFFHPYCNAGGGGERVLWGALRALQQSYKNYHFVIFTGDVGAKPEEILAKAKNNFNIPINPSNVEFVFLTRRNWIEADPYPIFTLLGQSIGSVYLGLEALSKFRPDVFIDTMGYAFTLPLFKILAGSSVAAYVHYPTISTDMLNKVAQRTSSYNNQGNVANSQTLSSAKLLYYRIFARIYSIAGRYSEVTMVNSSWTEGHILQLWQQPKSTFKVYPPCDVQEFTQLVRKDDDVDKKKMINIVSVSQFRPEKDHALQIKSMKALKSIVSEDEWSRVRLILLGSVRNDGDAARVESLKQLSKDLGIESNVIIKVNFSFEMLKQEFTSGLIAIHTMWNEHFGISVVECMAAGLIMVAHKSGGPLLDIVLDSEGERNGFLADNETEYAQVIKTILDMSNEDRERIRRRGRSSVDRFSDQQFETDFMDALKPLLNIRAN